MLRSLASLFLNPFYFFYTLLFLGVVFYYFQYPKSARMFWGMAAVWMFTISMSPIPTYLAKILESRFAILAVKASDFAEDKPVHVLVLGGGHFEGLAYKAYDRLSEPALKRLLEGIHLYNELPSSKLFCSGYSGSGAVSQAETLAEAALMFGVSIQDTLLQPAAVNTEMEARIYKKRFGSEHPLIIVTSALHMPRAMFWFQHYGLNPLPAPTNHLVIEEWKLSFSSFKPSIYKISITAKLLHEYAGMLYAYFTVK